MQYGTISTKGCGTIGDSYIAIISYIHSVLLNCFPSPHGPHQNLVSYILKVTCMQYIRNVYIVNLFVTVYMCPSMDSDRDISDVSNVYTI